MLDPSDILANGRYVTMPDGSLFDTHSGLRTTVERAETERMLTLPPFRPLSGPGPFVPYFPRNPAINPATGEPNFGY